MPDDIEPTPKPKTRKNDLPEKMPGPLDPEPKKKRKRVAKKHRLGTVPKGSKLAKPIMRGERRKPAVPKNKALSEIYEMEPDDPSFKRPEGRPRTTGTVTQENAELFRWKDVARGDKQVRQNGRRAKSRKAEATAMKAIEVLEKGSTAKQRRNGIYDEDVALAEGIITLDDWDDEELVRGYRRNRSGKFGPPPKFVPREIQHEIFKRIVNRGDSRMRQAYLDSIQGLIELTQTASDKVKLEATKELMNRVVGKVPDRVHIAQEQPWEEFLSDAVIPLGDEQDTSTPAGPAVDNAGPLPPGDTA